MSKQYQIPGGPYVNIPEDGTEYALPGYGYLNQTTTGGGSVSIVTKPTGMDGGLGRLANMKGNMQ